MSKIFEQMIGTTDETGDKYLFLPEPDEPPTPPALPGDPTGHSPGSREKIEVMARRFGMGLHIHHVMDMGTCTSLPQAVEDKMYVQDTPGLSLRTRENGSQKGWFVGVRIRGVWIGKHFNIRKYEEAKAYLEDVKRGVCSDVREVYEELLS